MSAISFDDWWTSLSKLAEEQDVWLADQEAYRLDYDDGMSPEEIIQDEINGSELNSDTGCSLYDWEDDCDTWEN